MRFTIRRGQIKDCEKVFELINELAEFENAADKVENNLEQFVIDGFGREQYFLLWVAETDDNQIAGMALCYKAYSTWKGKMLYLDDLVVKEKFRRKGLGQKFLDVLIRFAYDNDFKAIKWQVLDWNEPAINLYAKNGLTFDKEWIDCKMNFEQISNYLNIK